MCDGLRVIEIQKMLMKITGIWPEQTSKFSKIKAGFSWFIVSSVVLYSFFEILFVMNKYEDITNSVSIMISPTTYLIKHVIFIFNGSVFKKMLYKMNEPIFLENAKSPNKYIDEAIRSSKKVSLGYQLSCASVILLFFFKPLLTPDSPSVVKTILIVDEKYTYCIHTWQSLMFFCAAWNNSCLDTLIAGLMILATAHFENLIEKITNVMNGFEFDGLNKFSKEINDKIQKRIYVLVEYHNGIVDFVDYIENVFSFMAFIQFLHSIVVICNIGFQMFNTSPTSFQFVLMVLYAVAMLIELALYCWYGNELTLKSMQVKEACYMTQWIYCDPSVRKSLFLIMERSKRPVSLTAGKLATLSLQSLVSVLHSAYSFFAVLRRMYNNVGN